MESLLSVIIIIGLVIFSNAIKSNKGKKKKDERKPNVVSKRDGRRIQQVRPENKKSIPSKLEDAGSRKRAIAIRLMEGDPVPEGFNGYVCAYCGAVNLVKKGSKGKHCCYFCHDPID